MPRDPPLTEREKGVIDHLDHEGLNKAEIARQVKRKYAAVDSYIRRRDNPQPPKKRGRPSKVSEQTKRQICRLASKSLVSCAQIKRDLQLNISIETIRTILHNSPYMVRMVPQKIPYLSKVNKNKRLKWCTSKLRWRRQWRKYIFSDEKKFCLDGPVVGRLVWGDVRKPRPIQPRRQGGGGSVTVWAAFGYHGKTPLMISDDSIKAASYRATLQEYLLPVADEIADSPIIFQQDNAPPHTATTTKEWLNHNISWEKEWPAQSPDLNPMENMWAILSRKVYADMKVYKSKSALIASIQKAWAEIGEEILHSLIDSMPNRMEAMVKSKGLHIDY